VDGSGQTLGVWPRATTQNSYPAGPTPGTSNSGDVTEIYVGARAGRLTHFPACGRFIERMSPVGVRR